MLPISVELVERLEHAARGRQGALSIIGARFGYAEDGKDGVADVLVDGSAVKCSLSCATTSIGGRDSDKAVKPRMSLITMACGSLPNARFVLVVGRYQNRVGLPVDGKAGPETVRMLLGGDFASRRGMAAAHCPGWTPPGEDVAGEP